MTNIDDLERLAKAAMSRGEEACESLDDWLSAEEFMSNMLLHPIDARFAEACTPAAIVALIAELRALREDAARYQWIRDPNNSWGPIFAEPITWNGGAWARLGSRYVYQHLDQAIDAARKEKA